jgi:hypothetical protein
MSFHSRLDRLFATASPIDAATLADRRELLGRFADSDPAHLGAVDAAGGAMALRRDSHEAARLRRLLGAWLAGNRITMPGASIVRVRRLPHWQGRALLVPMPAPGDGMDLIQFAF